VDRVQLAAIALAVAMIAVWIAISGPGPGSPPPAETQRVEESRQSPQPKPGSTVVDDAERHSTPPPGGDQDALTSLENDSVVLQVSSRGGRLASIRLKQFAARVGPDSPPVELVTGRDWGTLVSPLGSGPLEQLEESIYQVERPGPLAARHVLSKDGIRASRTLELDPTGYGGRLQIALENRTAQTLRPEFSLVWYAVERPASAPDRFLHYSLVAEADGQVQRRPLEGIASPGFLGSLMGRNGWQGERYDPPSDWAGVDSQYFLEAAIPENPLEAVVFQGPLGQDAGRTILAYPPFDLPPGHRVERSFRLYFGPKLTQAVAAVDPRLDRSLEVGWSAFRPLVDLFTVLLRWTHDHVIANYGIAIILLTILLRVATFPLTQKSMTSMKRFSAIAPQMKALQEKHKDDRERLQQEMMALYRSKGMNPLSALGGGCIPMLIQFPFLIALYFALQSSIELRHAPFMLWIDDLSAPEHFLEISGVPIRPLPLLMGVTMVLQQMMTPSAGVDPQQRRMMMWMSVFFIFLFYQFPSGLVLYWLVSNVLGILQQLLVNRQHQRTAAASG
jgi:YidC/Oxa1 family membrane protein insertase